VAIALQDVSQGFQKQRIVVHQEDT
jgi:hypothetical protein